MVMGAKQVHDAGVGGPPIEWSVAVDGINPTLALAALLFGISGNPQGATHQSAMNDQAQERLECAAVAEVGNPAQLPQGTDPIVRPSVPAARVGTAPDGCAPER
jgi:hypothetical protein